MRMVPKVMLVLMILFSAQSYAAVGWFIQKAEVVKVSSFTDGTYVALQVYFRADPANVDEAVLGSACPPTWEAGITTAGDIKVISWRSTSNPGSLAQAMYSAALSAQAQGLPVDINVNTGSCMKDARLWGYDWDGIQISIE